MIQQDLERTIRRSKVFSVLCLLTILPPQSTAISTRHYAEPPPDTEVLPQPISAIPQHFNVSLSTSERQKRLLPYENFYLDHNNNRPIADTQYQPYQTHREPKKPILIRYVNSKKYYQPQNNHHNAKFTPFLESNALRGGFRPIINNNPTPVKFEYIHEHVEPQDTDKVPPNFSVIYDKLSQLKLRQQNFRKPYVRYQPNLEDTPPPQIVRYQEDFRPYPIQPSKTTIETFTATNIDIPETNDNKEQIYQQYEPQKTYYQPQKEHVKPYVHEQIVIDLPPSSYAVPNYRPPQKHIQRKPIYFQQRARPKNPPQRVVLIKKKPESIPIIDEQYVAEKFLPQKYEPQYQATPQYEPPRQVPYQYEPQHRAPPQIYRESEVIPEYDASVSISTENTNALSQILKELQKTNTLPQTLSAENIDNSIKTLVRILEELKKRQKYSKLAQYDVQNANIEILKENQPHVQTPPISDDSENAVISENFPADTPEGGTPGKPGIDYPALSTIPQTSFNCKTQRYKGFFGDPDTNCQVWHYCDLNGGQASFLCPNGTIFSQVALTCDWWYNVKCASTTQLYVLNERLYKYIIPLTPKFPEDYSGPLVDKYLALKFQEMEEKLRKQKKGKGNKGSEEKHTDDEAGSDDNGEDDDVSDDVKLEETKKMEAKVAVTTIAQEIPLKQIEENVSVKPK